VSVKKGIGKNQHALGLKNELRVRPVSQLEGSLPEENGVRNKISLEVIQLLLS